MQDPLEGECRYGKISPETGGLITMSVTLLEPSWSHDIGLVIHSRFRSGAARLGELLSHVCSEPTNRG